MARSSTKGPQFVRYFVPVLKGLQHLGGSGTPEEVREYVATTLKVSDQTLDEVTSNGQSRFNNQVHWARFYLAKAGLIDSSKRGVWSLTERGIAAAASTIDALEIFQEVQSKFRNAETPAGSESADDTKLQDQQKDGPPPDTATGSEAKQRHDHREPLLELLRSLAPSGFERFCMRLLRESGFQQVEVTGRSGDGGIDGHGILQINPLVSFRVLFQCKRYKDSISPSQIRDFRGAMMGRADKGIFMTTGIFTRDARKEAVRDGVPPIELVDSEKLLEMLETLELGVRPITILEIDNEFFDEFR